jgi:hypothetical protein
MVSALCDGDYSMVAQQKSMVDSEGRWWIGNHYGGPIEARCHSPSATTPVPQTFAYCPLKALRARAWLFAFPE